MALTNPPAAADLELGDSLPSALASFRSSAQAVVDALGMSLPEALATYGAADLAALVGALHATYQPLGGSLSALPRSGYYVTTPHGARLTFAMTLERLHYSPLWVPHAITLDRIGIEVTTVNATAVVRLGIYASTADRSRPGALLVDAGTVDAGSATGLVELIINQALAGGLYWLASVTQVATATVRGTTDQIHHVASTAANTIGTTQHATFRQNSISGALPNGAVPSDTSMGTAPLVFVRVV